MACLSRRRELAMEWWEVKQESMKQMEMRERGKSVGGAASVWRGRGMWQGRRREEMK